MALVYHAFARSGTYAASVRALTGISIAAAALSMRKASRGRELLAHLLPQVLRPFADPALSPDAFHAGLRLVAIDGTASTCATLPPSAGRPSGPDPAGAGRPAPSPPCSAPCWWNWARMALWRSPWAGTGRGS
ncbi:MAG: hypothetical protein V4726_18155 [Verrucomicrobiota bacterium]